MTDFDKRHTCWRELITERMRWNMDSWSNVIDCTIGDLELDRRFDATHGKEEGVPFTLWTWDWVYFSHEYDGADLCLCVRRNPEEK